MGRTEQFLLIWQLVRLVALQHANAYSVPPVPALYSHRNAYGSSPSWSWQDPHGHHQDYNDHNRNDPVRDDPVRKDPDRNGHDRNVHDRNSHDRSQEYNSNHRNSNHRDSHERSQNYNQGYNQDYNSRDNHDSGRGSAMHAAPRSGLWDDDLSLRHRPYQHHKRSNMGLFADPIDGSMRFDGTRPLLGPSANSIDPFGMQPAATVPRQQLKLATFNVWGLAISQDRQRRIDAIGRYFTKNPRGIDILALQELWMADDYRTLKSTLSLEFPHSHYFRSGVVGSGLAVFSKYPIRDAWWRSFTLGGKAHRIFDGDWFAGKGVGAVRAVHPVLGAIDLFVTHLIADYSPHDYDKDWYKAHRATQLYELIRHVDRTSSPTAYTFLLGDMNTQPVEDAYVSMLKSHDLYSSYRHPLRNVWHDVLRDAMRHGRHTRPRSESSWLATQNPDQWSSTTMKMQHGNDKHFTFNLPTNSYHSKSTPVQQIDHIFYVPDGRVHCVDAEVFLTHPTRDTNGNSGPSFSDHAALLAVFDITPSNQVILNRGGGGHARHQHVSDATRRLMVRLNEEIHNLGSQRWAYRIGAMLCAVVVLVFVVAGGLLVRPASTDAYQQRMLRAEASEGAKKELKWHERIPPHWLALVLMVLAIPLALYCQWLIWNAVVFLSQEQFAFREFQYEWALWLRKH